LRVFGPVSNLALVSLVAVSGSACESPDPELMPDQVLRAELGLTDEDRVHTIRISTGVAERPDPVSLSVAPGDWVQFVTVDGLVHEVAFELDSLRPVARTFLVRSGQVASPPLLERDARFVVSFAEAPAGRYPYALQGNRAPGAGSIVVVDPDAR
jgi:plastocyanin